jgi:hypothetical protein
LLQHETAFLVGDATAALSQFDHLVRGCEVQFTRERSLEVGLNELALPAVPVLER